MPHAATINTATLKALHEQVELATSIEELRPAMLAVLDALLARSIDEDDYADKLIEISGHRTTDDTD